MIPPEREGGHMSRRTFGIPSGKSMYGPELIEGIILNPERNIILFSIHHGAKLDS